MEENPIYGFMKKNNLTDLDEASFIDKYSNPENASQIYSFMRQNNLTELEEQDFYGKYLARPEQQSAQEPISEEPKKKDSSFLGGVRNFLANINQTALNIPADIAETYAVAVAFSERMLAKAGVPFTDPNLSAKDVSVLGMKPYKAGEEYRAMIENITPVDEEFKSTFVGGVSQGLGQVLGMLATGGTSVASQVPKMAKDATKLQSVINAGKELTKSMTSTQGLVGGSMNAAANYRQAIEEGATEEQALQFGVENLVVGSIFENLPIQSMFGRIAKMEPNAKILDVIKQGIVGAGEEGVTEGFQTTYENMSAQRIYDVNKEILEGVGDAAAVGGTVGFILNASMSALMGRRVKVKNPEEEQLLDQAIVETQEKIDVVEENNENIKKNVEELEKVEFRELNDGEKDYSFVQKDDSIEYTEEGLDESSANETIESLSKKYPNMEFEAVNNTGSDPLAPADFTVRGKPKAEEPSYKVGDESVPKEAIELRIEAADSMAELEGISIENDSDLESVLKSKVESFQETTEKPITVKEESQANEGEYFTREIDGEEIVYQKGENTSRIVTKDEYTSIEREQTEQQPTAEESTIVEDVREESVSEGVDTEVSVEEQVLTEKQDEKLQQTEAKAKEAEAIEEVNLQEQLDETFESIAKDSKDPKEFIEKAREVKGVSPELSKYFREKYVGEDGTLGDASTAYWNEKNEIKTEKDAKTVTEKVTDTDATEDATTGEQAEPSGERVSFTVFGEAKTGTRDGKNIIGDDGTKYTPSMAKDVSPIKGESALDVSKKKVKALTDSVKKQINEDNQGVMFDFEARAKSDVKFYNTIKNLVTEYVRMKGLQVGEAIKAIEKNIGKKLGKANEDYIKKIAVEVRKETPRQNVMTENQGLTKAEQIKQGLEEILEAKSREAKRKIENLREQYREKLKDTKDKAKEKLESFKQMKEQMIEFIQLDIKDLPSNSLTKTEVSKLLNQIKNANTDYAVNRAIEKIYGIFGEAGQKARVSKAKEFVKKAKQNVKEGKIGVLKTDSGFDQLFRINPKIIPRSIFPQYMELLESIGARKKVLSLKEKARLIEDVNDILTEVDNETSKVAELAELYRDYDKVTVKDKNAPNGVRESYSATVDRMLKDGAINEDDKRLMKDRRTEIIPESREFTEKTEVELQAEKDEAVKEVLDRQKLLPETGGQFNSDENNVIRSFKRVKKSDLDKMPVQKVKMISNLMDNISNGVVNHLSVKTSEYINAVQSAQPVFDTLSKYKGSWIEWISATKGKIKGTSTIQEKIRRVGLYAVDKMLNDFKDSNVVKNTFWKLAKPNEQFNIEYNSISKKVLSALDAIKDQWTESSIISMLKLQTQHNLDPTQPSAKQWLEATIKEGNASIYGKKALDQLQEIFDKHATDGEFDLSKVRLSKEAKNLLDIINEIQDSELAPKVEWGSTNIRGNRVPIVPGYTPTPARYKSGAIKSLKEADELVRYHGNPSTKSGTFNEKTKQAHAISFDPVENLLWSARNTLIDYHMTSLVREVNNTIQLLESMAETDKQKEAVGAIKSVYSEVLQNVLGDNMTNDNSMSDKILNFAEKKAYQALLGGVVRPIVDLGSNITYAGIQKPKETKRGAEIIAKYYNKAGFLSSVAKNVKSVELTRLFSTQGVVSRIGDASGNVSSSKIRGGKSIADKFMDVTKLGDLYNKMDEIADMTLSTPDQIVSRSLFFGTLDSSFKRRTGKEIDLEKIADNDQEYIESNFDAISESAFEADQEIQEAFSSANKFLGIPRNQRGASKSAFRNWMSTFEGFMNKFTVGEYVTAITAIKGMMGQGSITRAQGARLMSAQSARLAFYSYAISTLPKFVYETALSAIGLEGDDEEEDKSIETEVGSTLAEIVAVLAIQRNLGNWAKIPTDIGIEYLNKEFGQGITYEGDYNPYTKSIGYPIIPLKEPTVTDDWMMQGIIRTAGPYSPLIKSSHDLLNNYKMKSIVKDEDKKEKYLRKMQLNSFQIAGSLGFIPFYRDLNNVYKTGLRISEQKAKGSDNTEENPYKKLR